MKESDWKKFTKIKDKAIDTFCNQCFDQYKAIMNDQSKTAHERYAEHYDLVHQRNKRMAHLFDGHSRSGAWLQLLSMRVDGLADKDLVSQLSEEFQHQTDPKRHQY